MKLDELINIHYKDLNENDIYIWNYISTHRKECEKMVIDQLAYKCNVSRTTILRFAQKLSLKGYSELKVYLRMENKAPLEDRNDFDKVCFTHQELASVMREKDCSKICKLIDEARNLYIYGTGMIQNAVQKEVKRIFLTSGKFFYDINGFDELRAIVSGITKDDLVVVVSLSGNSQHILNFVTELNVRSVPIISITRLRENQLARMSTHNLYLTTTQINEEQSEFFYESVTSYLFLVELLFLKYIEYRKNKV